MTIDQLIDGYIDIYHKITRAEILTKKCAYMLKNYGFTLSNAVFMSCHFFNRYDAKRKAKDLIRQREILKTAFNLNHRWDE